MCIFAADFGMNGLPVNDEAMGDEVIGYRIWDALRAIGYGTLRYGTAQSSKIDEIYHF